MRHRRHITRRTHARAPKRKTYKNHDGAEFSVGAIVTGMVSGQRGIVIKILPPYPGDSALGHRAWVAFDEATKYKRFAVTHPSGEGRWTEEASASEAAARRGKCLVKFGYLDHLKPVGQAKRVPKCVLKEKPSPLKPFGVEGHWS